MALFSDQPTVNMPFIRRSSIYTTEKAYGADVYTDEIACSNIRTQQISGIQITDLRTLKSHPNFSQDGVEMVPFQSTLQDHDYFDQAKVEAVYCKELAEIMRDYLQADAVQVFEAQVGRRHKSFPHRLVDIEVGYQPAMRPHIDASREHTIDKIEVLNGSQAEHVMKNNRWVYLNIWKPIKGPVRDWPLAFCDLRTVRGQDMLEADNIKDGEHAENIILHYDPRQRWMYISEHMPNELLLIRQADSEGSTGVAHAAFDLALPPGLVAELRESIEVRIIAYFSKS